MRSREEEVCYGCLCNPCVIGLLLSISVLHGASINGSRNVPFVTQKINTHIVILVAQALMFPMMCGIIIFVCVEYRVLDAIW